MNIGELFREFHQHKDLFQPEKNLDENISFFTNQNLDYYKTIVNDEKLVLEKLQIFLQQQFKKHGKSNSVVKPEKKHEENVPKSTHSASINQKKSIEKERITLHQNHDISSPNQTDDDSKKILLKDSIFLEMEGTKRILHFPTYKIIY